MMKAIIKGFGNMVEVDVKWKVIDASGLVTIRDTSGCTYMTHLCNVIFLGVEK